MLRTLLLVHDLMSRLVSFLRLMLGCAIRSGDTNRAGNKWPDDLALTKSLAM